MAPSRGAVAGQSLSRPVLTLLGKPDCGLCHEMRDLVRLVLRDLGGELVEVDVRDDPELERRYLLEIPVLMLGSVEIVRHRTTEKELRKKLGRGDGTTGDG